MAMGYPYNNHSIFRDVDAVALAHNEKKFTLFTKNSTFAKIFV